MASITIKVDVDKGDLIQRFSMFQREMKSGLSPAWRRIASRMKYDAWTLAPVDTTRLIQAIRINGLSMGVYGISRAIDPRNGYNYAGIQHYGGYASGKYGPHMITGKFYMTKPLQASRGYIGEELDSEIAKIIARCGL